jgi:hypothetical protein
MTIPIAHPISISFSKKYRVFSFPRPDYPINLDSKMQGNKWMALWESCVVEPIYKVRRFHLDLPDRGSTELSPICPRREDGRYTPTVSINMAWFADLCLTTCLTFCSNTLVCIKALKPPIAIVSSLGVAQGLFERRSSNH